MKKLLQQFCKDSEALFNIPTCEKSIKRMAFLFALIALLGASVGIPFTADIVYYGMLILVTVFLIYKGGFKISMPFIALYSVIAINIIVVDIPPIFKPMQRALLFILLTLTCSSAMDTNVAVKFRAYLFKYFIFGTIIIAVGSFFCFFAGINLMSARSEMLGDFDNYSSKGGWFSGLASHSMMLGPISMISALAFYFLYQKESNKIFLILFFTSAMSAAFAASRAALLALVIAIAYNLIFGKVNATIRKRMIGILVVSGIMTIPIAGTAFKGVINKQETRIAQTGSANSREGKFNFRINEFKSSPVLGVGFCAIDINGGDAYNPSDGKIEPGTSHLSVLSMLGILGTIVYIAILYKAYINTKLAHTLHSRFVFSCFIGFFVHAWFEGYIFAAGGFLALFYWLIIGQCIDCNKTYNSYSVKNLSSQIVQGTLKQIK